MTSFIDAFNNTQHKIQERITYLAYLEHELASKRHDGYTEKGLKEELKKLKKEWTNTFTEQSSTE
jgi:hypothetical protein